MAVGAAHFVGTFRSTPQPFPALRLREVGECPESFSPMLLPVVDFGIGHLADEGLGRSRVPCDRNHAVQCSFMTMMMESMPASRASRESPPRATSCKKLGPCPGVCLAGLLLTLGKRHWRGCDERGPDQGAFDAASP